MSQGPPTSLNGGKECDKMSQIKARAKAIKNGTDNERHYDRDLIDILSEEVVGVFDPLIADKNLLRLVLAHAYAKECARNHRNGTPSEDLAESQNIVGEMIIDCLYGFDPEYKDIFDEEEDDEDDIDDMDTEEDSDDSFTVVSQIRGLSSDQAFLRGCPGPLFGGSFGMRSSALRTPFSFSVWARKIHFPSLFLNSSRTTRSVRSRGSWRVISASNSSSDSAAGPSDRGIWTGVSISSPQVS